jgi:glycerophosphoryl diester phosphodiesterase
MDIPWLANEAPDSTATPPKPDGDREVVTKPVILTCVSSRYRFLDHPGPIAFAHRGGAMSGLENSMPAFQRAIDMGYQYLETDVHATADGVTMAFHDDTLDRVTDRTGQVAQLPYAEVAKARIAGVEPIPRLEDVLGTWPDIRVNIDVKSEPAIAPLAETLHRTKAWDRVCVASFSDRRLAHIRARMRVLAGRDVCTSLGPRGVALLKARSVGVWRRTPSQIAHTGVACAQVPYMVGAVPFVTRAFLDNAHARGLQVHVWTVNERQWMERLLDLGVDGIITDELHMLREVMEARGLWPNEDPRASHPRSTTSLTQRRGVFPPQG